MNAHLFTATAGSKSPCSICGKTRNTKEHKAAKALDAQVDAQTEVEMAAEATTIAEARAEMLPEVSDATDDSEVADALEAAGISVDQGDDEVEAAREAIENSPEIATELASKPAKKAASAKKAPVKKIGAPTATIWVGWRITNAAVLTKTSVAKKLRDAKPTADLDRTVKLTVQELQELDAVAAKFMEPGHTGPEIYSGRALRGRIATALAKLQDTTK